MQDVERATLLAGRPLTTRRSILTKIAWSSAMQALG